jgi:hypothetical protein
MVETTKCDHCGANANFVITKEFDGKLLNFCCQGCLGVFEMLREAGLPNPAKPDSKDSSANSR